MAAGKGRRRLLRRTLGAGAAFVVLATAVALMLRPDEKAPYVPGDRVEGITADLERDAPEQGPPVRFADVAAAAGVAAVHFDAVRSSQLPEDMGSGVAWGDYDDDGDPDLYFVNQAGAMSERESWPTSSSCNRLFRNDGDGTFTDVTAEAGVGLCEMGMGAAWGDADGDRDLDLVVTSWETFHYFRNRGDGTFADATETAGLTSEGPFAGASWGDPDRDGDLDLYVTAYVHYTYDPEAAGRVTSQYDSVIPASLNPSTYEPAGNLFFRNEGNGTFTDVTAAAGVVNAEGRSLGATWCDFDEDGWPDLYVANDISDNVLYHNLGDGTFADVSHAAWVADYRGAMGMAVGDWDGDADQDMFVSHWIAQENALYTNLRHHRGRDDESLHFVDDADRHGLGQIALDHVGWGTFFFDMDTDGRPDLFVANGSTFQRDGNERLLVPMRPLLFWNRGTEEGFLEVGPAAGPWFAREAVARGAASADYDRDGDVDFAVVRHGEPLSLLRAEGPPPAHWLGVTLRGQGGNTWGVGAKVLLETGETKQAQVVGATPSYLSQPELTLHFGVGTATTIDRLEVTWPDGRVQELTGVSADQLLVVEQPP